MILVGAAAAGGGCRVRPNHPLFAGLSELAWIDAPQPIGTLRREPLRSARKIPTQRVARLSRSGPLPPGGPRGG